MSFRYLTYCTFWLLFSALPLFAQEADDDIDFLSAALKESSTNELPVDLRKVFESLRLQKVKECSDLNLPPLGPPRQAHRRSYVLLAQALCLHEQKKQVEAAAHYKDALKEEPTNSDALLYFGIALLEIHDLPSAVTVLAEAHWYSRFEFVKKRFAAYMLAEAYRRQGSFDKAAPLLRPLLSEPDLYWPAFPVGAMVEAGRGNKPVGLKIVRFALEHSPNDPRLRLVLARILLQGADRFADRADISEARSIAQSLVEAKKPPAVYQSEEFQILLRALVLGGALEEASARLTPAREALPTNEALEHFEKQLQIEILASLTPTPTPAE